MADERYKVYSHKTIVICIYTYTYRYVYIYICMYVYICLYKFIRLYIYIYIYSIYSTYSIFEQNISDIFSNYSSNILHGYPLNTVGFKKYSNILFK